MRRSLSLLLTAGVLFLAGTESGVPADTTGSGEWTPAPVAFEPNRGQTDPSVDFLARCRAYTAFLRGGEVVIAGGVDVLRMGLVGAVGAVHGASRGRLPGRVNYLRGRDPAGWIRNVPRFRQVAYREVLPGVGILFRGRDRKLRFDLRVEPGVDPGSLRLAFEGMESLAVDAEGRLLLEARQGRWVLSRPVVLQVTGEGCLEVGCRYVVLGKGRVGFELDAFDRSRPLVIDPTLAYATYLGAEEPESWTNGCRADSKGNVYVAGSTRSAKFPTTNGAYDREKAEDETSTKRMDIFVTKIDADGENLVYSTFIGGTTDEEVWDLDLDADGCVYVTGYTWSDDFPATKGAYETKLTRVGAPSGFILKLNSKGSDLDYATYLNEGRAQAISVDGDGQAHVASEKYISGPSSIMSMLVVKMMDDGSDVHWAKTVDVKYSDDLDPRGVAIGSDGSVYVAGETKNAYLKTTSGAYQSSIASKNTTDGWVVKLSSAGNLKWATYLGGTGSDTVKSVGLDFYDHVYVTGTTYSSDFPTTSGAYQRKLTGTCSAYLAKLRTDGASLLYGTYLGGSSNDYGTGLAVHFSGTVWITGYTSSKDFPLKSALQDEIAGDYDAYLVKLDFQGKLAYSTYFGGAGREDAGAVGLEPDGSAYVFGTTTSSDFPASKGAYATSYGGNTDAFVFGIPDSLPKSPVAVTTESLPDWTAGVAYSQSLKAKDGLTPYTWRVSAGSLPAGLVLSAGGKLTGTPNTAGTYDFTLEVKDGFGMKDTHVFRIVVNPYPAITTSSLPDWTVTRPYRQELGHTGGTGRLTWSLVSGLLPEGATLDPGGVISGVLSETGRKSFTVKLADEVGASILQYYTLTVHEYPRFVTTALPPWTETRPYPGRIEVERGTPAYWWSVVSGTEPTKGGLVGTTGAFDGPARSAGSYGFMVRVVDAAGAVIEKTFHVTVNPFPSILTYALPLAAAGRPLRQELAGTGGTPDLSWVVVGGSLPEGVTLDPATGDLAGRPVSGGDYEFDCEYRDATGAAATRTLTLRVARRLDLSSRASYQTRFGGEDEVSAAYYLELLAGTILSVKVKLPRKPPPGIALRLLDAGGNALDLSLFLRVRGKSVSVKKLPVERTGRYFLTVTPDPGLIGKVGVRAKGKPRSRWKDTGTLTPGGEPLRLDFSALPGALLKVKVKAAPGSPVLPHIRGLSTAGGEDLLDPAEVRESGKSAVWKASAPLPGGDLALFLSPREAGSGAVTWSIKLKLPKGYGFELPDLATR